MVKNDICNQIHDAADYLSTAFQAYNIDEKNPQKVLIVKCLTSNFKSTDVSNTQFNSRIYAEI